MTAAATRLTWWWLVLTGPHPQGICQWAILGRAIVRAPAEQAREHPNDVARQHGWLPTARFFASLVPLEVDDMDPKYTNRLMTDREELKEVSTYLADRGVTWVP